MGECRNIPHLLNAFLILARNNAVRRVDHVGPIVSRPYLITVFELGMSIGESDISPVLMAIDVVLPASGGPGLHGIHLPSAARRRLIVDAGIVGSPEIVDPPIFN